MFITRKSQNQFLLQDLAKNPKIKVSLGAFEGEPLKAPNPDLVLVAKRDDFPEGWKKQKEGPFLINSPGEYEIKGFGVQAIPYNDKLIFLCRFEREKLVYFFQPSQKDLSPKEMDRVTEADILFLSLDGKGLGPDKSSALISQLEIPLIIPMDYEANHLQRLAELLGISKIEEESSLSTNKLSLTPETTIVQALAISK
jgi:hypothetical protein